LSILSSYFKGHFIARYYSSVLWNCWFGHFGARRGSHT